MTIFAKVRAERLTQDYRAYAAKYFSDPQDIDAVQLRLLNLTWAESLSASPWARALRDQLMLPDKFESWEQYEALVPIRRKSDLRSLLEIEAGCANVEWRSTGGTTAEPIRLPVLRSEPTAAMLDQWLGRQRLGVAPDDRLFLLWGHAQMFSTGIKGKFSRAKRRIADMALGYTRWSAYRLTESDLAKARAALIRSGAQCVIGYSTALDRLARASLDRTRELHRLRLKVVIATAEGFPHADSRETIARAFGCPVVMEYGSVETGLIAYERLSGGFDVFWAHQRLDLAPAGAEGRQELLVTSLYPRAIPLLRYAIGDWVTPFQGKTSIRAELGAITGRSNDVILTKGGLSLHSEAFTHTIRDLPGIARYQVVCTSTGVIKEVAYESDLPMTGETQVEMRRRLAMIDASLNDTPLVHVTRLRQSTAGKNPMVIRERHP